MMTVTNEGERVSKRTSEAAREGLKLGGLTKLNIFSETLVLSINLYA